MSDVLARIEAARNFPTNTCAASRHAEQIGEALFRGEQYPMLSEEPAHCGESILSAVASLYEARTERDRLRAAVEALAALVQRDRVALYEAHHYPHSGEIDDEGREALAEYDAALRLADAAMGREG